MRGFGRFVTNNWKISRIFLPDRVHHQLVVIRATLFAVVVIWSHAVIHNANAAAVLPNTTLVALYKEPANIFAEIFRVLVDDGRTRVVLVVTDAARDFVVLYDLILFEILFFGSVVLVVLLALAAPSLRWLAGAGSRLFRDVVGCERLGSGGLLRRTLLVI